MHKRYSHDLWYQLNSCNNSNPSKSTYKWQQFIKIKLDVVGLKWTLIEITTYWLYILSIKKYFYKNVLLVNVSALISISLKTYHFYNYRFKYTLKKCCYICVITHFIFFNPKYSRFPKTHFYCLMRVEVFLLIQVLQFISLWNLQHNSSFWYWKSSKLVIQLIHIQY